MNKIKIFFEDVLLRLKNRLTSSRYVIKGKCKKCGACCRNILFSNERGYVKDEETFKEMRKKRLIYRLFSPNGYVNGEGEELEGAILFKCKCLKNNKCSIYYLRPIFCRDYPAINKKFIETGGRTLDNCGFYFEPDKKFSEYLR